MTGRYLVLAVVALGIAGCAAESAPATPSGSTPFAAAPASPGESPSALASAAGTPPATPAGGDISQYVRVLVPSWRPRGPTLLVDRRPGVGQGHVIVAVPVSGEQPVDLVALSSDSPSWDVRPDASAVVVSMSFAPVCGPSGACEPGRLAIVDLRAGLARWLTAPDSREAHWSPRWSANGEFIYYAATGWTPSGTVDRGIFRVRSDGSDRIAITDPVAPGAGSFGQTYSWSAPARVTADGLLLWYAVAGGSTTLRARDLASGSERAFVTDPPCVRLSAWREAAPNALVLHGACQEARAKLSLWDVRTGAQTLLVDRPSVVYSADWDRDGRRIVAGISDTTTNTTGLALVDGRTLTVIPGTADGATVRWTSAGIAYDTLASAPAADCPFGVSELRFLPAPGGASTTLDRGCSIGVLAVVGEP